MTMMRASSQSQKIEGLTKEFPEAVVQLDRELEAAPQNAGLWFQRAALLGEERLMRDALPRDLLPLAGPPAFELS